MIIVNREELTCRLSFGRIVVATLCLINHHFDFMVNNLQGQRSRRACGDAEFGGMQHFDVIVLRL